MGCKSFKTYLNSYMHYIAAPKQKDDAKDDSANNAKSASQSYNPSASVYHPIDDACWKRGDK